MRLGSALPLVDLDGGPLTADSIASSARFLEDQGFASLWTFDAVGRGFMLPDPLVAISVATTVTDTIDLGTGIYQLPIRNVVDVAHRALTVSLIAGSRFLFGVGPVRPRPTSTPSAASSSADSTSSTSSGPGSRS